MLTFMSLAIMIALLVAYYLIVLPFLAISLRHVPGPPLNKLSNIPLAFLDLLLCRRDGVLNWHRIHGPVVAIAPKEVSVATLDATRQIYSSSTRYEKSDYFKHFEGYDDSSVFATRSFAAHRNKRKLTSSFYQASSIYNDPSFHRSIRENVAYVLAYIDDHMNHMASIDVYSVIDWYAFDNITRLVLGPVHCSKTLQMQCPEREMLSHLKRCQFWGPFRVRFPWFFSAVSFAVQKFCGRLEYLKAEEKLAKWSQDRVLQILRSPDQATDRSLVQILTKQARRLRNPKYLDGFAITPSFVAAEALDNINAAEATVSVTTTYTLYYLSRHRLWQERIREELRQLSLPLGRHALPSFSDVHEVPVTQACLLEVYRLNPAISGRSERVVPDEGSVIEGVYIPPKTIISTAATAIHKNSQIFPNPEKFKPERWLDATPERRRTLEAHLQHFGYGARLCLGKALATVEIKLLLAGIYLRYETWVPEITNDLSMRQTSTHDAVPKGLRCDINFQLIARN